MGHESKLFSKIVFFQAQTAKANMLKNASEDHDNRSGLCERLQAQIDLLVLEGKKLACENRKLKEEIEYLHKLTTLDEIRDILYLK